MTAACQFCGDDPSLSVLRSWTFFVPHKASSANARVVNSGNARWKYAKEREDWMAWISAKRPIEACKATTLRRVTLTRYFTGRERLMDRINYAAGCKPILDAMVRSGLLVDDNPKHLRDHYQQIRDEHLSGVEIRIEEIG